MSNTPDTTMYAVTFLAGAIGIFLIVHNIMDVIRAEDKHRIVQFFFGLIGMVAGFLFCYWAGKCMMEFQSGHTGTYNSIMPLVNKLLGK